MSTVDPAAISAATSYASQAAYPVRERPTAEDRFARLDTDGDSVISRTEFQSAYDTREALRGERGGDCCGHGRAPAEYTEAVHSAQTSGGGGGTDQQIAALQQQVAELSAQLEAIITQVYGAGASIGSGGQDVTSATAGLSDAASAASGIAPASGAGSSTIDDGYQYATDEQGNTYALDGSGNVYAVAADGTGTLAQAAAPESRGTETR